MELQTVIKVIQDLCRKTIHNGCTEAEAMSAANKIGELMKVYNLSMDKVFLGESKCIQSRIETGKKRRTAIDKCVISIAEFCDCRVWFNWGGGYSLFGLETDVEMAKYLYGIIDDAINTATIDFKQSERYTINTEYGYKISRRNLSSSFQKGMALRISQRLQDMKNKRQEEEVQESPVLDNNWVQTGKTKSSGTSLILLKRNKVKEEFEQLGIKLKKAQQSYHRMDSNAYYDGVSAGDKVNLNRPIRGNVVGLLNGTNY